MQRQQQMAYQPAGAAKNKESYSNMAMPSRPANGRAKCLIGNGIPSQNSSVSGSMTRLNNMQQSSQPERIAARQDFGFDEQIGAGGGDLSSIFGHDESRSVGNEDAPDQMFMMQGGQGQGQGFQSQNASSIMHQNPSLNELGGFFEETSPIDGGDRISPVNEVTQQLGGSRLVIGGARTNETQQAKPDSMAEAQTLKNILAQLQMALVPSMCSPQVQNLLGLAQKHSNDLQEALTAERQQQSQWRSIFKTKVRAKLKAFKTITKEELQKAEEFKFKQQINEFELHERVSSLEQAYSHQQEEINKAANANEILKYEKIKLIQQHSKRLAQIETCLSKIQIQKTQKPQQASAEKGAQAKQSKIHHVRGHSSTVTHAVSPCKLELQKHKKQLVPPDSQQTKKRLTDELSKSFCMDDRKRIGFDSFDAENNSLLLKMQASRGSGSTNTQLNNLQNLIKQFKQHTDLQRQKEVSQNEFMAPLSMEKVNKAHGNDPDDQLSLSDIDFDPQQKLMNNFFTSQKEEAEENKASGGASSSGDVNRAVIMGESRASAGDDPDTQVQSFCGELAQQLNNTSFFAGQNKDILLPDNLNFFSSGDENGAEFKPQASLQKDEILQIEEDMACLNDDDPLNFSKRLRMANARDKEQVQDSDDKEVEDIFKDSSDSIQLESKEKPKKHTKTRNNQDVDLDDLMQASVATELKQKPGKGPGDIELDGNDDDKFNNFFDQGAFLGKDSNLSPVLKDTEEKTNKMDFMHTNEIDFDDGKAQEKIEMNDELSLALPDLSAIKGDSGSEDDNNLADLNRKLMPNFVVKVGEKQIKMPKLDIERVVQLEDRKTFKGNLKTQTASLQTDTILETPKDLKDVDNSGSFLNETGSKQVPSESHHLQTLNSKQKESQSDANLLDYLNKCDNAISAIIEDAAPFDDDQEIQVCNNFKNTKEKTKSKQDFNFLDSLREEIMKEENERLQVDPDNNNPQKLMRSPTTNSMPFELRDSFKSKLTDSHQVIQTSAVTYKNKQSLFTVGSKARESSGSLEKDGYERAQLRSIRKTDLTMSQKEFDKRSQMMRLSELDTGSNHLHNSSQKNEGTRVTKIGVMQMSKKIIDEVPQKRARAPSENQALERNQDSDKILGKLLSADTLTNGTDSIVGSLNTQSAFGDKSRQSAPVTFTVKQQRAQNPARDSAYTTEVVNEVDDEDSKILSANNSNSKLISNNDTDDQSMQILAYNSAFPHTTKNVRQIKSHNAVKQANQQQLGNGIKTNKVSIQRVQHHAEMSNLIKNQQQKSSSIQRLKIVKKVSVSSAAAAPGGQSESGVNGNQRDILSSNSVERPSIGNNSSISLIEQGRVARINASSVNRDYSSGQGEQFIKESSNPRLSINTRKSKPITVSFKNIVKTNMQKRKTVNSVNSMISGQGDCTILDQERQRDDSEQPSSVVSVQRVVRNPVPVSSGLGIKPSKISVSSKNGEGKTLNITVMRNQKPKEDQSGVKQILKISNPNSSVQETRDGSIIFVGKRKTTVERVKPKRNQSNDVQSKDEEQDKRVSLKSQTKVLISANQIKQRKLSIGSTKHATNIFNQNLADSNNMADGSRVQTKIISPSSPVRLNNKSGVKIINQKEDNNEPRRKRDGSKPGKTVKKGSIISLKRRDVPVTEGSQNISSTKGLLAGITKGERIPSVGADGNQTSKRSANTTEAPNLKIKRMTKSKNSRPGSTRPNTVIRQHDTALAISQYNTSSVNRTSAMHEAQSAHDSLILRCGDMQKNQSNTILGDISLLSKLGGGGCDSRGQMMVAQNMAQYGSVNGSITKPNQSILINQSSQQNLPTQMMYDGQNSFQLVNSSSGNATKSAAGGKRVGLSRGSIEPAQAQVNQSQVVTASNFLPTQSKEPVSSHMQISQKAMKIISTQKTKHSGAQKMVQMEWKSSGVVQSSTSIGKHRNSMVPASSDSNRL